VPSPTDPPDTSSSDQPRTLPALEVNPLVNPLLAENMGRWAEVYFKSPPENREQAVRELLQQLEAENAQRGDDAAAPRWTSEQGFTQDEGSRSEAFVPSLENRRPQTEHSFTEQSKEHSSGEHSFAGQSFIEHSFGEHSFEDPFVKSRPVENQRATIHCRSCGHENRAEQRFCGMCGLPLQREVADEPDAQEIETIETAERMDREFRNAWPEEIERELPPRPGLWSRRESHENESVSAGLIRSLDYGTAARSYGVYIGVAVVVVVLALAYVGWRSSRATGYTSYATQPASAAAGQAVQQTPVPIPPTVDTAEQSANKQGTDAGVVASASKPVVKPNIERPNIARPPVERVSAAGATKPSMASASIGNPASATVAESQTPAIGGSGYEELAMAKRYLNGSAGQRNSAEAVEWLWKAVAKRNTDATLLLSEMFMRGDGISKNCDQARILLDAAASRGVKDAALRLRNMPAFGCQ
jgi:ribosomal protein L37E